MKRKALEEAGGLPTRTKRQQIELPEPDEPAPAAALAPNPTELDMPDDNDNDDSSSTTSSTPQPPDQTQLLTPTATSIPPSAASSTTTSRRARKFPSDLKTIKCTYPNCPKTFNRPARLAAHLRSHTNDRPHRCPYAGCGKTYLEEKHLAQHVKGTHTHERRYACAEPGCGKAFVTATRLRRHAAVHEGAERFRCRGWDGCALSFRKHQTLQRHVRVAHLGLPAYVCGAAPDECREGFDTAAALRRHVEREHGELRFWCEECGGGGGGGGGEDAGDADADGEGDGRRVGFRTLLLLQAHMRKEHVNCVFCDVKFGSQAELEKHVDMYHSGKTVEDRKTVECTWEGCDKKFTRASNLNTHIRTAHEGLRFVCGRVDTFESEGIGDWNWMEEGCGQEFVSKLKLEEHVRYVHLGMKRPPRLYTVQSAQPGEADEMSAAVPTRTIPCSVEGCPAMFVRHYDLDKHLRKEHDHVHAEEGSEDDAIDPLLQGSSETALHDEQFWIESAVPLADDQAVFHPDWVEMRRLIDLDALVEAKE